MPLQSREVLTPSLFIDCGRSPAQDVPQPPVDSKQSDLPLSGLVALPAELRVKILRYVLLFEYNLETHTRRLPRNSIDHLLNLDSRRILEAPQFKHKGKQEINGVLPTYTSCHTDPSVLRVCKKLCYEGQSVLYGQNLVAAIQCGISGLGARLRNYGVRVWGPLDPARIILPDHVRGASPDFHQPAAGTLSQHASFSPLLTFRGQNSKPDSPVYICGQKDITHLLHALWILIKCPFAHGMRFSVHVAPTPRQRLHSSMDAVIRIVLLPWMHNHIDKITGTEDAMDKVGLWKRCLDTHRKASSAEPNVYTYNSVCSYLEQLMASAEKAVDQGAYLRAESLHELVCYEACSIVRTRTGKLVDVSTKTKEGINRVCKLIAVSAFRLCELRSGAVESFKSFRKCVCATSVTEKKENAGDTDESKSAAVSSPPPCPLHCQHGSHGTRHRPVQTTRLDSQEAIDHAILSGLLALRLPCATPVAEWNVRINLMLLYLFNLKNDRDNAKSCIRRLHHSLKDLWKDALNKTGRKWTGLATLVEDLRLTIDKDIKGAKKRREAYQRLVEGCQDVVRKLWGERLTPKKGYIGLIWTFRWA